MENFDRENIDVLLEIIEFINIFPVIILCHTVLNYRNLDIYHFVGEVILDLELQWLTEQCMHRNVLPEVHRVKPDIKKTYLGGVGAMCKNFTLRWHYA